MGEVRWISEEVPLNHSGNENMQGSVMYFLVASDLCILSSESRSGLKYVWISHLVLNIRTRSLPYTSNDCPSALPP